MQSTIQGSDAPRLPLPRLTALLGLAVGIGPVAHYMLSASGPLVIAELGLSRSQFGALWVVTFGCAVALSLPAGRLADRFGARASLAWAMLLGTAGLVVLAVADSYVLLVLGLAFAGLAQAGSGPATNLAVVAYVAEKSRSIVVGFKQSAVQFGQLTAGLLAPAGAALAGWRTGFIGLAAVGALGLLGALRMPRTSGRATQRSAVAAGSARTRPVVALVVYAVGTGIVLQATNAHLPVFVFEVHGFSAAAAGSMTAVLGGIGVAARLTTARLLGPGARFPRVRSQLSVTTLVGLLLVWQSPSLGRAGLWLGVAALAFSAMAATLVLVLELIEVSAGQLGRASGYLSLGLMGGFMIGPILFGAVADRYEGYGAAWSVLIGVTIIQLLVNVIFQRSVPKRTQQG